MNEKKMSDRKKLKDGRERSSVMKKKLFSWIVTFVIAASCLSAMNVFAADEDVEAASSELYALNTSFDTAMSISPNTQYTDAMETGANIKWYKVTIPQNGYISLSFTHDYIESTEARWRTYLYDSEQKEFVDHYYVGNVTTKQSGNIGVPAGTYYLKVEGIRVADKNYSVKINFTASDEWEKEFNETNAEANVLSANTVVYGSLREALDKDWYKVVLPEAGYISLNFTHDYVASDSTYWKSTIYNKEMSELATCNYKGDKTVTKTGDVGVPAGTYYIKIEHGSTSDVDYNLKMNYTSSTEWETEFNDSLDTADVVNANETVNGSLANLLDKDWYKITFDKDGYFSFDLKHDYIGDGATYWRAYIYDGEQNELLRYTYTGPVVNVPGKGRVGVKAGTYYVKIDAYVYTNLNYNFKFNFTANDAWEKELNNVYTEANDMDAESEMHGCLATTTDVDWFKFDIEKSDSFIPVFTHEFIDGSGKVWKVSIYDAEMVLKQSYYGIGNVIENKGESIDFTEGTYYVKIENYNSSAYKEYNFKLQSAAYRPAGWVQSGDKWWYRNEDGTYPANCWKAIDGEWYYFDADGYMVVSWLQLGNTWYYLNEDGAMQTGWKALSRNWYYFNENGEMQTGWQAIGGRWYYFNGNGAMLSGWQAIGGQWYYFHTDGTMQTGWQAIGGQWYYFHTDGTMQTGWRAIDGRWYYFHTDGTMQTGWRYIDQDWYYFNGSGAMETGWLYLGNNWYYLNTDGSMVTGYKTIDGVRYYFNESGIMV